MNIRRAAVIMASTSREKSSKCMSSMASSDTRGMLAAYKSTRYKSSQVHQLFQALHPALLSCLSDMPHKSDLTFTYTLIQLNSELEMSFVSELLMPQANEEEGTGGGRGKLICRKKYIHWIRSADFRIQSCLVYWNCSQTVYSDAYYGALDARNIWAASSCEF